MAVVDGVISFAVEKITNFIIREATFLSEVDRRAKELEDELIRMRCFLKDAESRQRDDMGIRNQIAEIRNIAYDAEDVLEIYALQGSSSTSSQSIIGCLSANNPISLHDVGSKIDRLTARLSKLTELLPTYDIREMRIKSEGSSSSPNSSSSEESFLRRTYSHTIDQHVVGLEKDTSSLLRQLIHTDNNYRLVSICGMGGLGKTTLAKKVYHQCKVHRYFQFFVWIFVSQQWQKRNIWETLLYEVISPTESGDEFEKKWKKIQKMKDDAVAKLLRDELEKSKCLVVLDDIWDTDAWNKLKPGFPQDKEMKTKFIITTRNQKVALKADPNGYIHEPQRLNPDESWELFKKTAMPTPNPNNIHAARAGFFRPDKSMEERWKKMVEHCWGLPLAIVVLGGLLSVKRTLDEWLTVEQCIKSYLKGEKLGIFPLLALSYDDLPFEMKPCFLYLGVLPEDFVISTDRLINLWVAEGLVFSRRREQREGEEALEDIAYRYLMELADRYMVQVEKRDSSGRIRKCKMHDLMREFCLSKAEEENFFQVVQVFGSKESLNISSNSDMVTARVRRLSVHLNNFPGECGLECEPYPPFRSVLGFSLDRHSGINQPLMDTFVRRLKLLRVLDLEQVKGFAIPQSIGKLIHLRLLNVRSAWVGNLPASVGNLRCLLTLRLDPFNSARTLPDVFWKLKKLRHLYLPRSAGENTTRLQFAALSDLRTLVNFPASVANVEDLVQLTNLGKLKIVIYDEISLRKLVKIFESSTTSFNYLRYFTIKGSAATEQLGSQDVRNNILSRCPRLLRLKIHGRVVYKTPPDVHGLDEVEEDDTAISIQHMRSSKVTGRSSFLQSISAWISKFKCS